MSYEEDGLAENNDEQQIMSNDNDNDEYDNNDNNYQNNADGAENNEYGGGNEYDGDGNNDQEPAPPPYAVNDPNPDSQQQYFNNNDEENDEYQNMPNPDNNGNNNYDDNQNQNQNQNQDQNQDQYGNENGNGNGNPDNNEYAGNNEYQDNNGNGNENENENNANDYGDNNTANQYNNETNNDYGDEDNNAAAPAAQTQTYEEPEDIVAQTQRMEAEEEAKPKGRFNAGDNEYTPFFSNYVIRTLFIAVMFFFWALFAFAWWTNSDIVKRKPAKGDLGGAFGCSAAGAFFIWFGTFPAMAIAIFEKLGKELPMKKIIVYIAMAFYVLGGVLYLIGGMAVAGGFNNLLEPLCKNAKKQEGWCSAFAGVWFTEGVLIGGYAIIFGVDIWLKFMSRVPLRCLINILLFIFVSLVGFFCYAVMSTNAFPNAKGKKNTGGTSTIAAGYFFILILLVIYLLAYVIPFLKEKLLTPVFEFIFMIVFVCFGLLLVIGYWAYAGDQSGTTVVGTKKVTSALGAYAVSVSIIVLFMTFFMACDIQLGKYLSRFADEPPAAADANKDAENDNDEYGNNEEYVVNE